MALGKMEGLSESILKFGLLVTEDEKYMFSSDAESLERLFRASGLIEYGRFFEAFLRNAGKKKLLVQMLSSLSLVSIGRGSTSVRFRNSQKITEVLKVNIRKIRNEAEKKAEKIRNSFKQFAQWAITRAKGIIFHIGIYGVALAIVLFSVWYCFTFNVAASLGSLASNIVASLKAAFPILTLVIFIFCLLFDAATSRGMIEDARKAVHQFLA